MKKGVLFLFTIISALCFAQDKLSDLKGQYFGQTPPGKIPILFAPEIFKEELHSCIVFSPGGKELYYDLMEGEECTFFMKLENGKWIKPEKVPYNSRFGSGNACFSHDGKKIFFTSWEDIKGGRKTNRENIWYVERKGDGWSERKPLPGIVNTPRIHWQMSVAENGNLYYGGDDIYCARLKNGKYTDVEKLGSDINTDKREGTPFIAPDESYLIFSRSQPRSDLFISFRNPDGTWGTAKNMGSIINTEAHEICPQVTPDGKYFFFIRNCRNGELNPFWVDASIIDELR